MDQWRLQFFQVSGILDVYLEEIGFDGFYLLSALDNVGRSYLWKDFQGSV